MTTFPSNPVVGDIYDNGFLSFEWTGVKWKSISRDYYLTGDTISSANNSSSIDLSLGSIFDLNLSEESTVDFINPPENGFLKRFFVTMNIADDYTANTDVTVTWNSNIVWETGSAPTVPDIGETDLLEFYTSDGGTYYFGKLVTDNVS